MKLITETTWVINRAAILEEFKSRVSSDAVALSEFLFLSGVDLSQLYGRFFLQELSGGLRVFRREGFAVAAPWRI